MGTRFRLAIAVTMIASLFATSLSASAQDSQYQDFANNDLENVWARTDLPVEQHVEARTWIWGPGAITGLLEEPYTEATDGVRQVQYTDKSRMELPWNGGDPNSPWFITQGLLATELMTGMLQVGDDDFVEHEPADIPVAGDPDDATGPTYAEMGEVMGLGARTTGWGISQVLHRDGSITDNGDLLDYGVTDAYYIPETGHNIASVFWDFMNSTGTIYENGQFVDGPIFQNAFYAVGFPLTEAYWASVKVDNVVQDVLVQCFERRCLTYTPGNPDGWQVESGNIGQHYYNWRYNIIDDGDDEPQDPPVADSFDVAPASSTNAVGDTHEITVTVEDQYGEAFEGADVSAEVTGGPHDDTVLEPADASTDENGEATLDYEGTDTGTDTITVSVEGIDEEQTVTMTWAASDPSSLTLTIEPESPVSVDNTATLTALVEDDGGNPVPGVDVSFDSDIQGDLGTVATNSAGEAVIDDHTYDTPGDEVITATEQDNLNEDSETITWVAGAPDSLSLELFGADAEPINEVNTTHRVLATVTDQYDNPVADSSVTFSISGTTGSPDDGYHWTWYPDGGEVDQSTSQPDTTERDTNADGVVGFSYRAQSIGEDTIRAEVTEDIDVFDTSDKLWCDVIVSDGENIQSDGIGQASNGDSVCVLPGTYAEDVSVDVDNVTLLGVNPAESDDPAIIDGSVSLDSDGAEVRSILVTRSNSINQPSVDAFGIRMAASNTTAEDNIVRGFTGESKDWGAINGIQVFGETAISNIDVVGNTVSGLRNNLDNSTQGGVAGIKLQADVDGVDVVDNTVTDLHSAGWVWGVVLTTSGGDPSVPTNVTVTGNTMERLNDGTDFDVFTGDNNGRDVAPYPGGAFGVDGNADASEVLSFTDNNLLAPNGVESKDDGNTLDATCNWWGDASGPTHDDNAGGSGTWAYENPGIIDYDPWLVAPAPDGTCTGGTS